MQLADEWELTQQRVRALQLRQRLETIGVTGRQAFELFDADKNQSWNVFELCKCLERVGLDMAPAEVVDWLLAMDTDGDFVITWKEFFWFVRAKVDTVFYDVEALPPQGPRPTAGVAQLAVRAPPRAALPTPATHEQRARECERSS